MHEEVINAFYNPCTESFRIIHNCEVGFNIWGAERMLGHKLCKEDLCKHLIAGEFYSDTLLDSRNVTITVVGTFENPSITINGNTMVIEGEFNGRLTLNATGNINLFGNQGPNNTDGNRFIRTNRVENNSGL